MLSRWLGTVDAIRSAEETRVHRSCGLGDGVAARGTGAATRADATYRRVHESGRRRSPIVQRNFGLPRWASETGPAHRTGFPCAADIVGRHHTGAPTMPRPAKQPHSNLSDQPFVTMGGGALPLPTPTQPATLTATRVATKAISTFFIGVPLSSRHAMHTSCLAAPLVVRCPQWFTASVDSGALRRGLCP
jgi:hypothetical protein